VTKDETTEDSFPQELARRTDACLSTAGWLLEMGKIRDVLDYWYVIVSLTPVAVGARAFLPFGASP